MATTSTLETELARPPLRGSRTVATRGPERERVLNLLAVALPALLGLGLCLYQLTTRSLWLDESATVSIASQHGAAFGHALARDGGNMLAYYALLHVLIGWFGASPFVIRFPSAIFAGAAVAATALLALRLFGRRTAVLAGTLTAVSLSLVYWGQDARGYAPMVTLIAGSFLAFVALLERGAGWRPWVAYVVLMTAAIYTGLEAVLVIPAQLVILGWRRERGPRALGAVVLIAALCVPLAVLAAERGLGQLFWVPPLSYRILRQVVQSLTSAGLQPEFYTSTSTALLVLTLVLVVAGAARAITLATRVGTRAVAGPALVLSWLLVPALVAALETSVGQSIFQARYLLVSLPAVSLLVAWTLADAAVPMPLMLIGATAVITLRALQLTPAYGVSSENWRGATAYLVDHTRPTDCVAFYPLDNRQAVRYYLASPRAAPRPILPTLSWRQIRPFVEEYASLSSSTVSRLPRTCGRVWLVASHEGVVGGPPASQINYRRFVRLTSELKRLYPMQRSSDFGAKGVVTVTLYAR